MEIRNEGGNAVDGLKCIQKYLQLYSGFDWEPMKVLDGCDPAYDYILPDMLRKVRLNDI